jgi:predicted dehydrogenase
MDYMKQSLPFKLRKAARYARLYGVRRTLVKIRSQYHMRRHFRELPELKRTPTPGQHVGIIGCGKFAYAQVAYYLRGAKGNVIRGAMDIDIHRAASLARRYGAGFYTDDATRVIENPDIDLIYIASNHASHADYAIAALERGKHVHIEKPHVVTLDQLRRLCAAMQSSNGRVNLGFNRPGSGFGELIKGALNQEEGPAMMSWFVVGHAISDDHWYFRPEEGGRILGNLCHWTDFVFQMVQSQGRHPITINPTRVGPRDADIAVSYLFGDGTIGAITFSSKGDAFEGVRERFAAHRGEALIRMDDFQTLTVDRGAKKRKSKLRRRDHGHREGILASYALSRPGDGQAREGCSTRYVWETGELFLRTREALESGRVIQVEAFAPTSLGTVASAAP